MNVNRPERGIRCEDPEVRDERLAGGDKRGVERGNGSRVETIEISLVMCRIPGEIGRHT